MRLEDTQRKYLETIAARFRPWTVINSRTALRNFIRYMRANHPRVSSFSRLERDHIEGWLRDLSLRSLKPSTRRNLAIKLRVFLETIHAWGWQDAPANPLFRNGDLPPQDQVLPRPLSEDVDRALQAEFRRRGGPVHQALLFLRATGLRVQEFLDLEVDSLRRLPGDEWALHVPVGKLHSERVMPVDAATALIFQEILRQRGNPKPIPHPETRRPTHFLFVRPTGPRYGRDVFRYHLNKIEKEIRLREHPSPHRLRHSFATGMLRSGLRIPVLMKILGHRTIAMTLRYVKITDEDVRRGYLEALAANEERYQIPIAPAATKSPTQARSPQDLSSQLIATASALESQRRDSTNGQNRSALARIVEKIRKLAKDLGHYTT
jgi:site-specific recombinase XerD